MTAQIDGEERFCLRKYRVVGRENDFEIIEGIHGKYGWDSPVEAPYVAVDASCVLINDTFIHNFFGLPYSQYPGRSLHLTRRREV